MATEKTVSAKGPGGHFILLFGYMMLQLAILPLFESSMVLGAASDLTYFILVYYVVYSIRHNWMFWVSTILFALTVACYAGPMLLPNNLKVFVILNLFAASFLITVIISIVTFILQKDRVTLDAVLGGLCGYLMIGAAFTIVYINIELLAPGSFDFGVHGKHPDVVQLYDLLYFFSFVSLLTIGYGDIVPMSHLAQTLSVLEGVIGQFYVVFYVAVLVGLYIYGRLTNQADSGA
jgi:hypothetical protein